MTESCLVNNGGCDASAMCSHDPKTNGCQCSCRSGYANTGSSSNVLCTGTSNDDEREREDIRSAALLQTSV